MTTNSLELFLLDQRKSDGVIALARRGPDTAIEHLPLDAHLAELAAFGRCLGDAVTGNAKRPGKADLTRYGCDLFGFLFRDSLITLYNKLPAGPVSLQILTDRSEIKEVPWEYLVTPDRQPSPHRERSVIRVQPTCGIYRCPTKRFGQTVRILFVSADPVDQVAVEWSDVAAVIERAMVAQIPGEVSIKVVEGATRAGLLKIIQAETFDVFHFLGHGVIRSNTAHLVLQSLETGKSDYLSARDLAVALSGKDVQLAFLSACLSAAGNQRDIFGVLASALIASGIPAVVANQYPIPITSIAPFVGSVYRSLGANGDIDRAVAEGRIALAVGIEGTTGGDAVVEWGIPTLHRLPDAQQLFQL
jgi:hypothetical protein